MHEVHRGNLGIAPYLYPHAKYKPVTDFDTIMVSGIVPMLLVVRANSEHKSLDDLLKAVRAEKLLGVPAGDNVLRLLPPLTVTAEEAREGLARIERAAEKLTAAKAA